MKNAGLQGASLGGVGLQAADLQGVHRTCVAAPHATAGSVRDAVLLHEKAMRDWVAVQYKPLSGLDVAVVSPAGDLHRFDSLVPNHSTQLVDLEPGAWTVHNDSPCILRLQADFDNSYSHINTLCPSEHCRFNWPDDGYKLTATLCTSAQVFHRPSMDTDIYMQRAKALKLSKWEYLFYQYMVAARTACSRIPEGFSKTPDFTVVLSNRTIPVELKEFAPNESEKRDEELLRARGYGDVHDTEVGQRIARSTDSARSQLRSFINQNGDGPAILAIMDSRSLGHADPHHLAALFEGTLTVDVSVADSSIVDVYRREDRRRLPERDRILSAIVVLRLCTKVGPVVRLKIESGDPYVIADLLVYHNPHAEHPVSTDAFASFGFSQYVIGAAEPPAVHVAPWP